MKKPSVAALVSCDVLLHSFCLQQQQSQLLQPVKVTLCYAVTRVVRFSL